MQLWLKKHSMHHRRASEEEGLLTFWVILQEEVEVTELAE